jgi:type II secretory pathway predicted ATPase ExeA
MRTPDRSVEDTQVAYTEHFGMADRPFGLTPDPDFFFESRSHLEAMRRLGSFARKGEGIALLYGDVGTGKTLVCRRLLDSLDGKGFDTALVINPLMDAQELLFEILFQFGITPPPSSTHDAALQALKDFLLNEHNIGRISLLAMDEAQLLSSEALALLVDLSGRDAGFRGMLRIILFGQEEMATKLLQPSMEAFRRHFTLTHYLHPLSSGEIGPYVRYRLSKVGSAGSDFFTQEAFDRIYAASGGCPRIINGICDQSLFLLSRRSGATVNRRILDEVFGDEAATTHSLRPRRAWLSKQTFWWLALIFAVALALCGLFLLVRPVHRALLSG